MKATVVRNIKGTLFLSGKDGNSLQYLGSQHFKVGSVVEFDKVLLNGGFPVAVKEATLVSEPEEELPVS